MKKHKICRNCGKRFYRRSNELIHHWKRRTYCKRSCQGRAQAARLGKNRNIDYSYTMLQDQATALMEKTRQKMAATVVTYSSKNLSQEELEKLVPSSK